MKHSPHRDAGMVTAEAAAVLPLLLLVALVGVWLVTAAADHLRCLDAAQSAARAAARGERLDDVRRAAREAAPRGAAVTVEADDAVVAVDVAVDVTPLGGVLDHLPAVRVAAHAVAQREPDGGGSR